MPQPTPDEYRYAKAHLRQALADLEMAKHYLREDEAALVILDASMESARVVHAAALDESLKRL